MEIICVFIRLFCSLSHVGCRYVFVCFFFLLSFLFYINASQTHRRWISWNWITSSQRRMKNTNKNASLCRHAHITHTHTDSWSEMKRNETRKKWKKILESWADRVGRWQWAVECDCVCVYKSQSDRENCIEYIITKFTFTKGCHCEFMLTVTAHSAE